MSAFHTVSLDALVIDDEAAIEAVAPYSALKRAVLRDGLRFRIAPEGSAHASWARVLFFNLTFWHGVGAESSADILADRFIPADVVAHVAWHHLAAKALGDDASSAESMLLGESIASAFDLYLIGSLLARGSESEFLRTQVDAMFTVLQEAGRSESECESWLEEVASDPSAAFESLRALLFDLATGLLQCSTLDEAARVFDRVKSHRFNDLLHHYELSNWLLHSRAYAGARLGRNDAARAIDAALRASDDSVAYLSERWLAEGESARDPRETEL